MEGRAVMVVVSVAGDVDEVVTVVVVVVEHPQEYQDTLFSAGDILAHCGWNQTVIIMIASQIVLHTGTK